MATFEERLMAIEQGHVELKEKIELQTIAIGALVNKATLERINEKNDKIFQVLINHDDFTNRQLAESRTQLSELNTRVDQVDGKIVGMQTEVRQSFAAVNARLETMATKDEINVRFDAVNARLETMATKDDLNAMNARFDQIVLLLNTQKPDQDK